jgi:hypothetical protein
VARDRPTQKVKRTFAALVATVCAAMAQQERIELALPTENDALFANDGPAFYQHIERDYQGVKSQPWQGGQYGFVRDPVQTHDGLIYARFHEGIDIRPLQRDAAGEPLDEVRAIGDGIVVHTNTNAAWSNYGNYIVIEHRWAGAPYYSLYGHLKSVDVKTGRRVARGEHIGQMGYTGAGLNQERAHVHLELNMNAEPRIRIVVRSIQQDGAESSRALQRHQSYRSRHCAALSRAAQTAGAHDPAISRERRDVLPRESSGFETLRSREAVSVAGARRWGAGDSSRDFLQSRRRSTQDRAAG